MLPNIAVVRTNPIGWYRYRYILLRWWYGRLCQWYRHHGPWWRGRRTSIDESTVYHMEWKCVVSSLCLTLASLLSLLDAVRNFDHQVGVGYARIVVLRFGHSFVCSLFHLLLVSLFDIVVKRATSCLSVITSTEVLVIRDVLGADIAKYQKSAIAVMHRMKNWPSEKAAYHCTFRQCGQVILLHPNSLTKACLHLLQCRIRADDIASSTTCLTVSLSSFLASSQLRGICVSLLHSRQLVFRHLGFMHLNSLSISTGRQSALKSQNGHSDRKSKLAAARSSCCCMCSSRSKDTLPRKSRSCLRVNVPSQLESAKQTGRQRELPISPSTYFFAHGLQKKCTVLPEQLAIRFIGKSSKQQRLNRKSVYVKGQMRIYAPFTHLTPHLGLL